MNSSATPMVIDVSFVYILLVFVQVTLVAVLVMRWVGGRPLHKGLMFLSYRLVHFPMAVQVVMTLILFVVGGLLIAGTLSGTFRFYIPEGFNPR